MTIIVPALALYIGLIALWLVAETKWSKRVRITCGIAVLVMSLPLPLLVTFAITQLDDNSYYASSVAKFLDETIEALESGEAHFLTRLKRFREAQSLSYENRGDLLDNVRAFRDEGKILRQGGQTESTGAAHAFEADEIQQVDLAEHEKVEAHISTLLKWILEQEESRAGFARRYERTDGTTEWPEVLANVPGYDQARYFDYRAYFAMREQHCLDLQLRANALTKQIDYLLYEAPK